MKRITNIALVNAGSLLILICLCMLAIVSPPVYAAEEPRPQPPPKPVTTADPTIPVDELELLVEPLTADELLVEADAWLALLKTKVAEISRAEIEVKRKNRIIEHVEKIKDSVGEAKQALEEGRDNVAAPRAAAGADRAVLEAQKAVEEVVNTAEKAAGGTTSKAPVQQDAKQDGAIGSAGKPKLEQAEKAAEAVAESKSKEKSEILDIATALREERTGFIDRLNVVLDELNAKLGKTAAVADNEKVVPYRLYAQSVGGLKVDISDTQAAYVSALGWLKSGEGGIRWVKNVAVFLATVLFFWLLGVVLSKVVGRALSLSQQTSVLLSNFGTAAVRYFVTASGIIIGLSALEVNVGPLLALVGAAGFVIAFALQDTLSNFASGLMIMLYKPFDVGDVINVGSLIGTVKSMSLVNTTISTSDNQVMIVPNNSIWGSTITNITGSESRRVDLVFGISHQHDVNRAEQTAWRRNNCGVSMLADPGLDRLLMGSPLRRSWVARKVLLGLAVVLLVSLAVILLVILSMGAAATRIFGQALMLSALLSVVPIAVLRFLDRRERESPWLFAIAILWGALIATGLALPSTPGSSPRLAHWLESHREVAAYLGPKARCWWVRRWRPRWSRRQPRRLAWRCSSGSCAPSSTTCATGSSPGRWSGWDSTCSRRRCTSPRGSPSTASRRGDSSWVPAMPSSGSAGTPCSPASSGPSWGRRARRGAVGCRSCCRSSGSPLPSWLTR